MSRYRVAVVGLGQAGYGLHLPALARTPSATVVGACDLEPARRALAARRWKIPVFGDFDEMLSRTRPDVVVVGTPPDSHGDYCLRSLAAGAHVICEKPFVASLDEADRVIAAAAAAGRRIALNHQFREMPIFRALLDATDRLPSGGVAFAQVWQMMDLPPWAEPGWRGRMLQRTLYEAGAHLVDLVLALFRAAPVSVSATFSTCGVREVQSDAVALVTLEFPGGRLAQIVQNRLCKGETQYFEVRAETAEASFRASFGGRARLTAGLHRSTRPHLRIDYGISGLAWKEVGNRRMFLARNPKDPGMIATSRLFEQTLGAFRDGSRLPASAEDGRHVLEVIAACYHAHASSRRIILDSPEARELGSLRLGSPVG
jgi:predicted dehydrogenase